MDKTLVSESEWEKWLEAEMISKKELYKEYGIHVEGKRFTDDFFHMGEVALHFKDCIFEKKFTLTLINPSADMFLHTCEFKGALYIGRSSSEKKINFLNCTLRGHAIFDELTLPQLVLNLIYASEILFGEKCFLDFVQIGGMERNKIDNLILNAGIIGKQFEINHTDIGQLRISSSALEGELIIANSYINNLSFDNFRNSGYLKFLNCKALETEQASSFVINQSNMGKTEFFKFNFKSFGTINITNSVVLESLFINSQWSDSNIVSRPQYFTKALETRQDMSKEGEADNLREVLKQVKFALSKQGDTVQEQFFHGLEMNEYYKTLSFTKDFWTKLIIKLSYLTSNYGQSLARPLAYLIGVSSFLYFLMFISGGTSFDSIDVICISNYPNTIAAILNFMNPFRRFEMALEGFPLIIDLISRIVSSYLLYNIIRATRRFVK